MFGSSKGRNKESGSQRTGGQEEVRVDTLTFIGPGVEVEGSIAASAPLRVDGTIRGEIDATGEVSVGETGTIEGRVHSESILIAGQVNGNVAVTKQLRLLPSGKLIGDAKTPNLVIEEGALFKGECEMTGPGVDAITDTKAARAEAATAGTSSSSQSKAAAQTQQAKGSTASSASSRSSDASPTSPESKGGPGGTAAASASESGANGAGGNSGNRQGKKG